MVTETNPDPGVRRELGEVVGTLRMTVNAVDQLRETVEHLRESVQRVVERAAFKSDLESLRSDTERQFEASRTDVLKALEGANKKLATLEKWMWTMGGIIVALGFIGRFIQFPARIVLGG